MREKGETMTDFILGGSKITTTWLGGFLTFWQRESFWGFPDSSVGKESACNAGDPGLIPGLGRSPGEGIGRSSAEGGPKI